jgi:hypothetical protein
MALVRDMYDAARESATRSIDDAERREISKAMDKAKSGEEKTNIWHDYTSRSFARERAREPARIARGRDRRSLERLLGDVMVLLDQPLELVLVDLVWGRGRPCSPCPCPYYMGHGDTSTSAASPGEKFTVTRSGARLPRFPRENLWRWFTTRRGVRFCDDGRRPLVFTVEVSR